MPAWFGRKKIGYGVGPTSWQGWLVTALLAGVLIGSRFVQPQAFGLPAWARPAFLVAALAAYFAVMALTYRDEA